MVDMLLIGALICAGLLFIVIEVFIVPGFSVPGLAGLALIGYGIFRAGAEYGFSGVAVTFLASLAVTGVIVAVALKTKTMRRMSLESTVIGRFYADASDLVGKTGTAHTTLRPSGTAVIEGMKRDVVADCEFIESGTPVRVVETDGGRIVVSPEET